MEPSAHWVSGHGGPWRGWLEKSGFDQAWWVFPELDAALTSAALPQFAIDYRAIIW